MKKFQGTLEEAKKEIEDLRKTQKQGFNSATSVNNKNHIVRRLSP